VDLKPAVRLSINRLAIRRVGTPALPIVFREKITGTTADRPQLRKLMAALTHGDVVIIPAVDRLSRDTTDLLVIARDMQRAGAGLRSIAEPVVDTTSDFAELVLAMLGVAAKLERRRIAERTARGRADAKAKGVKFGRKPSLTPHQQREARERLVAGETQRSVARSYNVSQATISRLISLPISVRLTDLPSDQSSR
jgi:DNA invertase Pin-like site-specific DNA recombinase